MGGGICLVPYRLQKPRGKRPRPSREVRVQEVGRGVQCSVATSCTSRAALPPIHRATEVTEGPEPPTLPDVAPTQLIYH